MSGGWFREDRENFESLSVLVISEFRVISGYIIISKYVYLVNIWASIFLYNGILFNNNARVL